MLRSANPLTAEQVNDRLAGIQGTGTVEADLVWEPEQMPYCISEAGRRQLGIQDLSIQNVP
jgi:metal-sulfur cluster biosynthetic enzyme